MKIARITIFMAVSLLMSITPLQTLAQDTIVQWTFPGESGLADGGIIAANLDQEIETAGGTSVIQFKNGSTTKAAQATEWQDGANEKKWKVEFATTGYTNLSLSSKLSSGGQNPGPRDFKVQYKVGDGSWTDLEESNFQVANDWETGVLTDLTLPLSCGNEPLVKIRWIMTSDTATDGSILGENGICKIDDIYIKGDILDAQDENLANTIKIFPNPSKDFVQIQYGSSLEASLFDLGGKLIQKKQSQSSVTFDLRTLNPAMYILKIEDTQTKVSINKQLIIQ